MADAPEDSARMEASGIAGAERPGAGGIVGAVGLFAVGFVLMALLVHSTLRDPLHLHADMRSEKLEMLARLQGSVYSASFGSSHVHNGFAPAVFDRELDAGEGPHVRTQTINLAVSGGSQAEQRTMALHFVENLKNPPPGETCMVLLELNAGANFLNDYLVHPRTIDIYDWRTAKFISTLTSPQMSMTQRVGRTGYAMAAAGLHYINLGMLSNRIFAPPTDETSVRNELANDRRGQQVLEGEAAGGRVLEQKIAALPRSLKPDEQLMTPGNAGLAQDIEAASLVKDLAFVYFVYPKLEDLSGPLAYPDHVMANGREIPIINLARPDLYPWLYQPKYWHDEAHLDSAGSTAITTILADRLKEWYAVHGAPPTCGGR